MYRPRLSTTTAYRYLIELLGILYNVMTVHCNSFLYGCNLVMVLVICW